MKTILALMFVVTPGALVMTIILYHDRVRRLQAVAWISREYPVLILSCYSTMHIVPASSNMIHVMDKEKPW
jgi:hypothetical protein